MATITNSNLYPPTIDTYMPAFLVDGDNELKRICRIYFSISSYNSFSDITGIHTISFIGGYTDDSGSTSSSTSYCDIRFLPTV